MEEHMIDAYGDSSGVVDTMRSALWSSLAVVIGGAFLATFGSALVVCVPRGRSSDVENQKRDAEDDAPRGD
jgi:hypothetical protein